MKFTNEGRRGAQRAMAMNKGEPLKQDAPTPRNVQKVDTSVRLGPITDEICGGVDIKSPAYTGKF